jgi:hypothetical protein
MTLSTKTNQKPDIAFKNEGELKEKKKDEVRIRSREREMHDCRGG